MPAKSKAQLRFMAAVASGSIKKPGLSKSQASEWVHATKSAKGLPERKFKKKTNNSMKSFGETDLKKKTITINKKLSKTRTLTGAKKKDKYPGVLDTEIHETLHAKHPAMTEKIVRKKTKKIVKKMDRKAKKRIYSQYR